MMKASRIWAALAVIAVALTASGLPARAQLYMREANPSAWLRQIYDLYKRAEKEPALQDQASYRIIQKRASKSLTALFKKNDDCEAKGQGVCAIDWDFIVDGQDYTLTQIKVGDAVITGDKALLSGSDFA